jgi:hypothetical protein
MFGALINAAACRAVCADRLAVTGVGAENTAGSRSPTSPVESHSVAQVAKVAK